eukprot:861393-Pelagomonas_calceolata.AAC.1
MRQEEQLIAHGAAIDVLQSTTLSHAQMTSCLTRSATSLPVPKSLCKCTSFPHLTSFTHCTALTCAHVVPQVPVMALAEGLRHHHGNILALNLCLLVAKQLLKLL